METKSLLAGVIVLCALANLTEGQKKCTYKFTVPDKEGCSSADASISDLQTQITNLAEQFTLLLNKFLNISAPSAGDGSSGAVYVRWGRTTCPDQSDQLYRGFAAGSHYSEPGGSSELLCLPKSPEWLATKASFQGESFVYGVMYRTGHRYGGTGLFKGENAGTSNLHNQDIPCSVCYTPGRAVAHKFPATLTCPDGWREEYHGYLMAGWHNYQAKMQALCVDEAPEAYLGSSADQRGGRVYNMEARCGSLPCPPYEDGKELACVICSR